MARPRQPATHGADDDVKGKWEKHEIDRLNEIVWPFRQDNGKWPQSMPWTEIAKHHKSRSAKQCRERWYNSEDPTVNRSKIQWGSDEAKFIINWVAGREVAGNPQAKKWAKLRIVLNRSENDLKNFWHQAQNKLGKKADVLQPISPKQRQQQQRKSSIQRQHEQRIQRIKDGQGHSVPSTQPQPQLHSPSGLHLPPLALPTSAHISHQQTHHQKARHFVSPDRSPHTHHHSRRSSDASMGAYAPSLIADNGSDVESPRTVAVSPYHQTFLPPPIIFPSHDYTTTKPVCESGWPHFTPYPGLLPVRASPSFPMRREYSNSTQDSVALMSRTNSSRSTGFDSGNDDDTSMPLDGPYGSIHNNYGTSRVTKTQCRTNSGPLSIAFMLNP